MKKLKTMLMGTYDSLSSNKGRELIQRSPKNRNWKFFSSYDTYTRRRGITCLRQIHLWHSGPPIKKPSLFPQPELCCLYAPILFQNLLFQSLHQLLAYGIIRHYCGRRWHREYNAQAQAHCRPARIQDVSHLRLDLRFKNAQVA